MYGQHIGPLPIPLWLVRWVFRRIALVYDLVVVPRREELVSARAVALRRLRRALEHRPVGLTPEGVGQFALVEPPDGTGLLLQMLTRRGAPLLPVAAWEQEDSTLVVRFGPAFQISVAAGPPRHERDNRIRTQAMVAIGRLMPSSRWGAYAEAIAESVRASGADEAT